MIVLKELDTAANRSVAPIKHAFPEREYLQLKQEIAAAVFSVLASGDYKEDRETAAFEEEFAAFCGVPYAVNTASGTMALLVGLKALGLSPGDEVITSPYSCTSTTSAITLTGATIRFADVRNDTLAIDARKIEPVITKRTRAILPVHIHGQLADMDAIKEIAARHDLVVLEDAALSVGATYQGRRTGGLGQAGAFSFAPGKVLGGLGWGGMVTTDDPQVAARARQLAGHGPEEPVVYPVEPGPLRRIAGHSAQMSAIQSAGLRIKLRRVQRWVERRRAIAARYDDACDRLGIERNHPLPGTEPSYRVYIIRVRRPERARELLLAKGIKTLAYFVPPLHLRPIHDHLGYQAGDFPVAERATDELLALPIHPLLTEEEIGRVITGLETLAGP